MAEAAESTPLHRGLPDEIAVWEILVRLPPKPLLRCRAVCRAWRRATSTRAFLLAHHGHQPALPLLCGYDYVNGGDGVSLHVTPFDHRAAVVDQLQPVARLGKSFFGLDASCDGLLVLGGRYRNLGYSICNPTTRQYARLHQLDGFAFLGMYPHSPTGEYRLLLGKSSSYGPPVVQDGSYVFTLGSGEPPRRIRCPYGKDMVVYESFPVLYRGNLHWHVEQQHERASMIQIFNTTTESVGQMCAPAVCGKTNLFEMDGMLGMSSYNNAVRSIDIWMMQDYESEAWAFKCRVELPVEDLTVQFGSFVGRWMVSSWDGDLLLLLEFSQWLLQIDMHGNLVTSSNRILRCTEQFRLKQTLVPHAFFPTLEGYVVNGSPFI